MEGYNAVLFRRSYPQVMAPGGLWDQSMKVYPFLGGVPRLTDPSWRFPSGARVRFAHLQHADSVLDWMGSELAFVGWDELTLFTESQFWYLLSRNRSLCGVPPYVRASCNPDADSWVASLLAWWIDQESGLPIPERAGVLRWFVRINDRLEWGDSPEDLLASHPAITPKSLAFVPARLSDNPILTSADPGYLANLLALPLVERERLLGGNWKVRPAAGLVFNRAWFRIVEAAPAQASRIRAWDKASTAGGGDYTAGVRIARSEGVYYVEDVIRGRWSSGQRNAVIRQTAQTDGPGVAVWVEQEGGSGGKESGEISVRELAGFNVHAETVTGKKIVRAHSFSAQCEGGNVRLLRGAWNAAYLDELHGFDGRDGGLDDQVDASSLAFNKLVLSTVAFAPSPPPEESLADRGEAAGVWGSGGGVPGHF